MKRSEFTFFWPIRVRYSEIDAQGIVFNAHYLSYFDVGLTEYSRVAGDEKDQLKEPDHDYHMARSVIDYQSPIYLDDIIHVAVKVARIGRSSIQWCIAIFRQDEEDSLCVGEVVWVYTDQLARQSAPIPDKLRQALLDPPPAPPLTRYP